MNKFTAVVVLLFSAVLFLSSCKSSERCPAYGKINQTEQGVKRV